jgi:hypothetical protein
MDIGVNFNQFKFFFFLFDLQSMLDEPKLISRSIFEFGIS